MFKNILSFKSGYRITIICAKILVFQSKLIMSSSSPTIEIITAQISFKENLETTAKATKATGTKCTLCWKIIENACDRTHCPKNT